MNQFTLPDGQSLRFVRIVFTNHLTVPCRGPKIFGLWGDPLNRKTCEVFSNRESALVLAFEITGKNANSHLGGDRLRLKVGATGATSLHSSSASFWTGSSGPWFTRETVLRADAFPGELSQASSLQIVLEQQDPLSTDWQAILKTNLNLNLETH